MKYDFGMFKDMIPKLQSISDKDIYFYPCGNNLNAILKMLRMCDITLPNMYFLDKNKKTTLENGTFDIQSVNDFRWNENTVVVLTSRKYEKELREELKKIGYDGNIEELFLDRDIDSSRNIRQSDCEYMNTLDFVLTTRCTLRCEKCANLMQYYEHPIDVEFDVNINGIKRILAVVDRIGELHVIGGEPFIYKRLKDVLVEILKYENIDQIKIITNATVCPPPDDTIWSIMSNQRISVRISDYGDLSKKKYEIIKHCSEHFICCEIDENKIFYNPGNMQNRGRTEKELNKVFEECGTICRSLFNGELHYCPRSAHGVDLGYVKKREEDYIDILSDLSDEELRNKITELSYKHNYIEACNYCDIRLPGYYQNEYPAAVQSRFVVKK